MKRRLLIAALGVLTVPAVVGQAPPATPPATSATAEAATEETTQAQLREAARRRGQALAEMEDGHFDRAVVHLEDLARILPDNILPPINLAICYTRLNRQPEARAALDRARALDPDNPRMLYTLARVLELDPGEVALWEDVITHFADRHPHDPRPSYLRARRLAGERQHAAAVPVLQHALELEPENLVVLADLLVSAAEAGDFEAVLDALSGLEDRLDGFDGSLADYADQLRDVAYAEKAEALRPPAVILRNLLRPNSLYQAHLIPLLGPRQGSHGMFPQQDFDPPLPESIQGGQDIAITFEDASEAAGLADLPKTPVALVTRRSLREGLLIASGRGWSDVAWREGRFQSRPILQVPAGAAPGPSDLAIYFAVDRDEIPDLVTADAQHGVRLHRGRLDGSLDPPVTVTAAEPAGEVLGLFPIDVDHDGDLDLFLTRAATPDLYLQNNGDGTWTEQSEALALAGPAADTTGLAVADFEDDGDLDLLIIHPGSHPRLYLNRRVGAFQDGTAASGLDRLPAGYHSVRTADFDNDGSFDLLLWGDAGSTLLRRRGAGFQAALLPLSLATPWSAAEVADFDNDGDQDVVVTTAVDGSLWLLRNRRETFTAEPLEVEIPGVRAFAPGDFDDDGDLDLIAHLTTGAVRFLSNQGGNRNHWLRLSLKGLHNNNAKNNVQGLFCRVEARVAGGVQTLLGNGGINHLGLGARRQADVVRVVWTNGLAQSWQLLSADRTLVEEQVLKGSCPFLYTWNGDRFEFVTDLMWKSPLGMVLPDGSAAPHQSAKDFVRVAGEMLQPVDGRLWLQVTEELWETAYVDRQTLTAVDHPADLEMVVDEKFFPPPHPQQAPIHWISERRAPAAARDHLEQDVLAKIAQRDGDYVDDLPLSRYQGLTHGHHLELTFADVPEHERLRLVLWGWIFPTDASINFALSQDASLNPEPPRLEVLGPGGAWRLISDFVGFPAGKRKAMVVELTDQIPPGAVTLRLTTSMQIYWDAATLAIGDAEVAPVLTPLEPEQADLHYRGYSRLYRASSSSPHLFDYDSVSIGPRFRDLAGAYTRFGPVTPLLASEDDRYVVMNAGDEMTVTYDATLLPPLPPGWRRDYVLYTDGWVKDGDLHTVGSQTVEPLPYHGMTSYPATPHAVPQDDAYRAYRTRYQTRVVTARPFRDEIQSSDTDSDR